MDLRQRRPSYDYKSYFGRSQGWRWWLLLWCTPGIITIVARNYNYCRKHSWNVLNMDLRQRRPSYDYKLILLAARRDDDGGQHLWTKIADRRDYYDDDWHYYAAGRSRSAYGWLLRLLALCVNDKRHVSIVCNLSKKHQLAYSISWWDAVRYIYIYIYIDI